MNRHQATQIAFLLLRVVSGLLFLQAGGTKLFGWFGGMPQGQTLNTQLTIGAWMEVVGGILIMLGLFTRPVAFLLSGEMAVAYWQFHAPQGLFPAQNQGHAAVLLCFIFLFMAAFGGGDFSIDALISKRKDPHV